MVKRETNKRNRIRKVNSLKRGKIRRKIPKAVGRVRKSNLRIRDSHKMQREIKKKTNNYNLRQMMKGMKMKNKKNNLHHMLRKRMKNSLVRKKQKLS